MNTFLQLPASERRLADASFLVHVLAAERTFWEKACLLHEETFRPPTSRAKFAWPRHYYDLWCLLRAGVGERALAGEALFQRVAKHREIFFRFSWVDYASHNPAHSALPRRTISFPTGAPITKSCSARCSSAKRPPSRS